MTVCIDWIRASGYLRYSFNWSAKGVVNEYLKDCEACGLGGLRAPRSLSLGTR
jgi:hypothetical protein